MTTLLSLLLKSLVIIASEVLLFNGRKVSFEIHLACNCFITGLNSQNLARVFASIILFSMTKISLSRFGSSLCSSMNSHITGVVSVIDIPHKSPIWISVDVVSIILTRTASSKLVFASLVNNVGLAFSPFILILNR